MINQSVIKNRSLTRTDIERLLQEAGGSRTLSLAGSDLRKSNLSHLSLIGADLREANLSEADLSETGLRGADIRSASLIKTNLRGANLSETNLHKALLSHADLYNANLFSSNMRDADLSNANLSEADLRGVYMLGASLYGANLHKANLDGVYIEWNTLRQAKTNDVKKLEKPRGRGVIGLDEPGVEMANDTSTFGIRIMEKTLTTYNLISTVSSITEIYTKLWFIAKGRFADLIE